MISQVVQIDPSPVPGCVHVSGYITDSDEYDRHAASGDGWIEKIERKALEQAAAAPPPFLSVNGGPPVARGSLKLSVDDAGLKMEADVHAGLASRIRDGIIGYAYQVTDDYWNNGYTKRTVQGMVIQQISIVTKGLPDE